MEPVNNDSWPDFFERFNSRHEDFIRHLSKSFPNLKTAEFRVCCFLRAGYTTRQIAEISGRTLRAVETTRYRLRKKMPLKRHEDLALFLMKL
ncbi:helix-turn-helix transcriptional regulator [Fidelibacter multiformis]|jgi:DNA-binding CsgD family transcriptional regulator|uniref:helix-turn-helix transcriptional regulator n=1 Tax=Fidelibacter multiformis TaxID=3377529 RepID=UPI0037DD3910